MARGNVLRDDLTQVPFAEADCQSFRNYAPIITNSPDRCALVAANASISGNRVFAVLAARSTGDAAARISDDCGAISVRPAISSCQADRDRLRSQQLVAAGLLARSLLPSRPQRSLMPALSFEANRGISRITCARHIIENQRFDSLACPPRSAFALPSMSRSPAARSRLRSMTGTTICCYASASSRFAVRTFTPLECVTLRATSVDPWS